jgi:hypothetical protein
VERGLLTALLARQTPPSAADLSDLGVLAARVGPDALPDRSTPPPAAARDGAPADQAAAPAHGPVPV